MPRMVKIFELLAIILLAYSYPISPVYAQTDTEVIQQYLDNVIQLTVNMINGDIVYGFGFVIAEEKNTLYIVTANHVVYPKMLGLKTKEILVRFYQNQREKQVIAELLDIADERLDVALLKVSKPASYIWEKELFCPNYQKGDKVWFIGRNRKWYIPSDDKTGILCNSDSDEYGHIVFDIISVMPGTSGAPLFTENGIIGMIIEDEGNRARAIPINSIRTFVKKKGYPWGLQSYRKDSNNANEQRLQTRAAISTLYFR